MIIFVKFKLCVLLSLDFKVYDAQGNKKIHVFVLYKSILDAYKNYIFYREVNSGQLV